MIIDTVISPSRFSKLVRQAGIFAELAHGQQVRKYTGDPYIVHPANVAQHVYEQGASEAQIAAAYLHDVVEDTNHSIGEVHARFGREVASLVWWMTDRTDPLDGNRRLRKQIEVSRWQYAPREAKMLKLADLYDNAVDIMAHDADGFGPVFCREARELLSKALYGSHYRMSEQLHSLLHSIKPKEEKHD